MNMDNVKERSAIIIQKCFRKYMEKIKENRDIDLIKSIKDESSFMLLTDNKSTDNEKVYEELQRFYQNLSTNKNRRTYLATLLNDIDENLSLLRNITSLDFCQKLEVDDKCPTTEEIQSKARDKHKVLLNDISLCLRKN